MLLGLFLTKGMTERCFIYELSCVDPKVTSKYLGYTTEWNKCMDYHEEKSFDPSPKSKLYFEIYSHGGWDNWDVHVLKVVKGRRKALQEKMRLLQEYEDEYTLNTHINSLKPMYRVKRDGTQVTV